MDKRRIQEVLGMMTKNLECSICLELLKNPVSTKCDHQFCRFCIIQFLNKKRSVPCPLCKKPVTERSLQEREELAIIVQNIRDLITAFQEDSGDIFTPPKGPLLQRFSPLTPEPLNSTLPRSKSRSSKPTTRNQDSSRTSSNVSLIPSESENDDGDDLQRTVKPSTRRKSKVTAQTKLLNGVSKHDKGNTPSRDLHCGTPAPNSCASMIVPSQKYQHDGLNQRSGSDKTKLIDSAHTQKLKPNNSDATGRLVSMSRPNNKKSFKVISLSDKHQICKDSICCDKINRPAKEKLSEEVIPSKQTPFIKTNIRQSKRKSCEVTIADELLSVLQDGSLGANTASTQSSFLHVTTESNEKHIEPVENAVCLYTDCPERSSVVSKEGEELLDHGSILEVTDDFGSRNYSEIKNSSIDSMNKSLSGINCNTSTKTTERSLNPKVIIQNPTQPRKPILNKSCTKSKNVFKDKNLAMAKLTSKRQHKKITRSRKIHSDSEDFAPSVTTDDEVIPETIQSDSQIHQTSQFSNVSYDVKFYDSPSKDPNRKKSRSVNQKTARRMSDRVKIIQKKKDMGSPETSCLTQGGVKTPKLVTRTYGRIHKGSLVQKTREDETWKNIVPAEEETFPQVSEGCDSDVLDDFEDSNATSVASYSSAFGFNTQNLAQNNLKNLQLKRPVNPKLVDKLHSKDVSTKQSVPLMMPKIAKGKATVTGHETTTLAEIENDTSTPPRITSKCTPVSVHGTPLKYGRGKLLPTPFDVSLDTSLLSKSADNSFGYIPKRTSHNRKVKVKMDAKGKLHMSLENRKSPRNSRNALKPISNTADIFTARSGKAAPSIIIMDPFEFKSSQTPKDRKRKQVRQRKSVKKSNHLAILGKKAALEILQVNQKSSRESSSNKLKRSVTFAETHPVVIDITQDSTHSDSESVLTEDSVFQDDQNQLELIYPQGEELEHQSIQIAEEPLRPFDPMEDPNPPDIIRAKQKKKSDYSKTVDDNTGTSETSTKTICKHQSSSTAENDITCIADSVEEDEAGSSSEKQEIQETPVSQSQDLFSGKLVSSPILHNVYDDSDNKSTKDTGSMKAGSGRKQLNDSPNPNHIQNTKNLNTLNCSHSQELFSGTNKKSQCADSIGKTLTTPKLFSSSNAPKESDQMSGSPPIDKLCKYGSYYITSVDNSILSKSLTPKSNNKNAKNGVQSASNFQREINSTVEDVSKESFVSDSGDNESTGTIPPKITSNDLEKEKSLTRSPVVVSESRNSASSTNESSRPQRKRKSLEKLPDSKEKSLKTTRYKTEDVISPSLLCTKIPNTSTDLMPKPDTRDVTKAKHKTKRGRAKKLTKEPENPDKEMLQLMNKINDAEDHDFVFSTQEALSRMNSEPAVNDTITGNHDINNTSNEEVNGKIESTKDNDVSVIDENISDEEAVEDSVLIRRSDEDVDQATVDVENEISLKDDNNISRDGLELQKDSNHMHQEDEIKDLNETHLHGEFDNDNSEMGQNGSKGNITMIESSPHQDEARDSLESSLIGPSANLNPSLGKVKFSKSNKENSEELEKELVNDTDDLFNDVGIVTYSKAEVRNIDDKDHDLIECSLKNTENETCSSEDSEKITTKSNVVSKQNECFQNRNPDKDLSTPLLYSPSQYKAGQSSSSRRVVDNLRTFDANTAPPPTCLNDTTQPKVGRTIETEEPLINEYVSDSMPVFSVLEPFQPLNTSTDNPRTGRPNRLCSESSIEPSPTSSRGSKRNSHTGNVKEIPKKKKGRKTKSIQAILRSTDDSSQSLNDSVQSLTCIPPTPMVERKRESEQLDDDSMETQDLTTADLMKENNKDKDKENGYINNDIDLQLLGTGDEHSSDSCSRKSKSDKKLNKGRLVQNEEKASNHSGQTESASESILKPDIKKLIDPAEPTQHLDSRKSLFSDNQSDKPLKEYINVGLEELSQGIQSDLSGSECSLLKRKRSFSSLRKQSRSGTPSSQNSCASLTSDSKGQDFIKDPHNDLIIAEANGVGSSEDELNVRRKKRKCFSLEGSPMSVRSKNSLSNQTSQNSDKSNGLKCPNKSNMETLDVLSQLSDKSGTNQNENVNKIVRKKKSLFTKQSKDDKNESPKLDIRVTCSQLSQKSDILMIVDSQNSERCKQSTSIKSSKPQLTCMSKDNSSKNVNKDGAKSQQYCPNDSQEDVIEILSSANPQRQSLENAETLPPSGLTMEWNKADSSEDEIIQDTFENEISIKGTKVVGKRKSHLKDTLQEQSDDEKENKFGDNDDDAVKDDYCGENERDSCDEVEEDQYADLPLTSSPVMATGRSVLSGLQPCDEEKSDSDVDDDVVRNVKRTRSAVIESDEDNLSDNESSTHMNSSSAFSSQSEATTQQRGAITSNILKMKEKIKQLEAELAVNGSGNDLNDSDSDSSDSDESDSIRISSKKKKQKEITTIRSSPEIENTKSDDSDSDLFLSPLQYSPPALEQEDDPQLPEVNTEMSMLNLLNQLTEQQVDGDDDSDEENQPDNISSKVKKHDLVPSGKDPVIQDDDNDAGESLPPTPETYPKIQDKSPAQHSQYQKVTQNEQKDPMIECVADSLPQTLDKGDRNPPSNKVQKIIENAQNLEEDLEPMSDEFDTCMESEEDMDQAEIPDSVEKNVKSSDEDNADLPDEVKKAMEILQKYKSGLINSQNSSASKLSNRSTPNSYHFQKKISEKSPLVNSEKVSTPSRISLEDIDKTLRDITPNRMARSRNSIENNSSDSTPIRRIPKFSSRKTTPLQSPRSSKDATPSKDSSIIFERKISQSKTTTRLKMESPRTPNHNSVIKRTPDSQLSERVSTPNRQTTPGGRQSAESRSVLSMRTPNLPVSRNKNLKCNFAASGLSKDQAENVIKLAGLNDCKFYGRINKHITHLIVKTVSKESRVCERTLKFFQAIAHKIWILSYSWVEESLKAGHMVLEDPYEIIGDTVTGDSHYGPSLARLSQDKLFQNLAVACVGTSNDMSKADMINLFESLGAVVVGDVDTLSSLRTNSQVKKLIISNKDTVDTELPPEEKNYYKNYYSTTGLVTVSREWVLDCISTYKLLSTKNYLFTPRPVRVPF